jgi:hypothetical protein
MEVRLELVPVPVADIDRAKTPQIVGLYERGATETNARLDA